MPDKSQNIIFLNRKSLSFFTGKKVVFFSFPADLINNQEVTDTKKFRKLLEGFFEGLEIKQKLFLIVLANELIYKKTIPLSSPEQVQILYEQFLFQVPFLSDNIISIRNYKEKDLEVLATNQQPLLHIKQAIEKLGGQVEEAIPLSVFNKDTLTSNDVAQIWEQRQNFQKFSFLAHQSKVSSVAPPARRIKRKSKLKFILPIFFVITTIGITYFYVSQPRLSKKEIPLTENPGVNQTPNPSATSSALPTGLTKEQIRIEVINGTGTKGLAEKVKIQLEKAYFRNINVETLPIPEKGASVVKFGPEMPATLAKEVLEAALKVKSNVVEEASFSATVDATIVLRK